MVCCQCQTKGKARDPKEQWDNEHSKYLYYG